MLESGYIEETIRDHRWSPFPMVLRTERPDRDGPPCENLAKSPEG